MAGYNGWSNYSTWCAHLWLTNDSGSYEATMECKSAAELENLVYQMADAQTPNWNNASLFSDLLGQALGEINFAEIYEGLHEE